MNNNNDKVIEYDFSKLLMRINYPRQDQSNTKSLLRSLQKAETDKFFILAGKGKKTLLVTEAQTESDAIKEISEYMNTKIKGMRMGLKGYVTFIDKYVNRIKIEEEKAEKEKEKAEYQKQKEKIKLEKEKKKLEALKIKEKMTEPTTALKAYNIRPVIKEVIKPIEKYRENHREDVQLNLPEVKKTVINKVEEVSKGSFDEILHHARETIRLITNFEKNSKQLYEDMSEADIQKNDFMHSMELMTMGELEANEIDMKLGKEILMKRRKLRNELDSLNEIMELRKTIHASLKSIYEKDQKLYGIRSKMFKEKIGSDTLDGKNNKEV